jgi:hypothetical protein
MKTYLIATSFLALVACSGGNGDDAANEDTLNSIVATTNPVEGASEFGQEVTNPNKAQGVTSIQFMEMVHDFGDVKFPSENLFTFKFKNTGSLPLIIESATASCGCTVPNKPEEAILPGQIGELDVIFSPKEGQQGTPVTKQVTVIANTDPSSTVLEIKANVLGPKN